MTTVTAPGSSIQLTETPMREESIDSTTGYPYLGVERREAPITFETEFLSDDDTDDDSDNASIGSGSGLSASYFEGDDTNPLFSELSPNAADNLRTQETKEFIRLCGKIALNRKESEMVESKLEPLVDIIRDRIEQYAAETYPWNPSHVGGTRGELSDEASVGQTTVLLRRQVDIVRVNWEKLVANTVEEDRQKLSTRLQELLQDARRLATSLDVHEDIDDETAQRVWKGYHNGLRRSSLETRPEGTVRTTVVDPRSLELRAGSADRLVAEAIESAVGGIRAL